MRIIQPVELKKLWNEIEPYLIFSLEGTSFKDDTPVDIKEKFEKWKRLYGEYVDSQSRLIC